MRVCERIERWAFGGRGWVMGTQEMKKRPGLRRISPWWTIGGPLTIRERLTLAEITVCNLSWPMGEVAEQRKRVGE